MEPTTLTTAGTEGTTAGTADAPDEVGARTADYVAPLPLRATWRSDLRMLLALAIPNVAMTTTETVMSFVDYIIISKLGPEAQAGVSSALFVYFTTFAMVIGIMVCVTTMVSQSLGADRPRDCSTYAWQGIWLSMAFGVVGVALWPVVPHLFAWMGHDPAVQRIEVEYGRVRLLGLGLSGCALALSHFFNGIHQTRINAVSVIVANVVNVVLSIGLVFGLWGLPQMGVAGAAWGTLVSVLVRVVWLLAAMLWGPKVRHFAALETWRPDWVKLRRLVQVGWPTGAGFLAEISAWTTFLTIVVGQFGTKHVAATATCWRFTELSFMPAVGIGMAISTMVGRAVGEGQPRLARRYAVVGASVNVVYMGALGLVFMLGGEQLMDLLSDDREVIRIGAQLLILVAIYQAIDAVGISYMNALRGAGDTRWPSVVQAVESWTIMLGGGWLCAKFFPNLGSLGPWIFATLFVIVISISLLARWRHGRWEQLDVIGREQAESVPVL